MLITKEIRRRLEEILDPGSLLEDSDAIAPYGHDETPGVSCHPDLVVRPHTATQIAGILELAAEAGFPVIPRGAGTGVVGGAIPFGGGVVLSLEKMDRILEIDRDNMMAVVEPAVVTGVLQREVEALGLFYPPDPASLDSCSLGGNVATGAGGPRAVKYGVTRNYVCGLEVVLPTGEILELGGKIVKYATGYHLMDLFIGSEGTLGVVTRITLRLLSLPPCRADLLVPFEKAGAHLLIEVDGHREDQVQADYEAVGEICLKHGAQDVLVADNRPAQEKLWEARRVIGEAIKAQNRDVGKQDVVVPRMAIPELVGRLSSLGAKSGVQIICFGHAGDGNVHINLLQGSLNDQAWQRCLEEVVPEIISLVYKLGGVLSGEHGIGWIKKDHLARILPPHHLELMRGLKRLFDPAGILNPGKVIDFQRGQ